ncbi:universal stress protein [Cellulosimicrobium composti]|uniref:Universal stress protein n=1 Tax=Cellulosimicrobium composti TaxID=2672572 RepID=A0ABX0BB13_9MICO|nr:universal stress protein [Cellulosimicrobium composti]NDO88251.1 universal stress protein [Cellulosimicrobium composti]TWG80116.1 nucleotide-binding universal stress UspA family protein [Cellulosimicrobium cellulans J34]SMF22375.1 Nucleotide-binding universal stress protein, UspA family [Cellulosimicrobium cellulans J1]
MSVVVAHLSTPEGREALDSAATEAVRRGTELVVVVTEASSATPELVAAHEDDLRRVEERLAGTGATLRREQGTSDLADDLVSAAERAAAELIVIGLRRRSPVGKLILGSNAQRILLDAPCPVLAVKPERAAGA